jgi:hypothetical protein
MSTGENGDYRPGRVFLGALCFARAAVPYHVDPSPGFIAMKSKASVKD